jgi:hypothetical protein
VPGLGGVDGERVGVYTAQLLTSAKAFTGNPTGGIVNATLTVSGLTGAFQDQNGGGCTPDNQTVRVFFSTPGFAFTNFRWSNPAAMTLNDTMTLNVSLDPSQWSVAEPERLCHHTGLIVSTRCRKFTLRFA